MSNAPAALELTAEEVKRTAANTRPRDAATLIVIDRAEAMPKVLFGRRHMRHAFMPGKYVFPGGGVEPGDGKMNVAGALHDVAEQRLMLRVTRGSPAMARALALAAIRETFEEAGLLIGSKDYGAPDSPPPGSWTDFAAHGVFPGLEDLHFIARAITPPGRTRRFDARFFAIDASHIAHRIARDEGEQSELLDLVWQPLDQLDKLDLPTITRMVLRELEARIAAGFGHHLPVPFFLEKHKKQLRDEL